MLKGLVNEIRPQTPDVPVENNLRDFLTGVLFGNFPATTFAPLANAKVHVGVRSGGILDPLPSFFPALSLEADTRADGRFEVAIPDELESVAGLRAFVVVFKEVQRIPRPNAPPIRLFEPLYRSELFPLNALGDARLQFFGATVTTEDTDGISSAEINAEIDAALEALAEVDKDVRKLKDISATITPTGLHFAVRGAANTRGSFDLQLSPNTGPASETLDTDLLLRAKITNVVAEPGNLIGKICRSRAKLEASISRQAGKFARAFSGALVERLKEAILEADPQTGATAITLIEECFSLAVANVRFPLVETTVSLPGVGPIPVTRRLFGSECKQPPAVD